LRVLVRAIPILRQGFSATCQALRKGMMALFRWTAPYGCAIIDLQIVSVLVRSEQPAARWEAASEGV
jgi:hypothetical protein